MMLWGRPAQWLRVEGLRQPYLLVRAVSSNLMKFLFQYYMQYASQPFIYRESPNPAFHEAVAHAIGLNIGGPVHLQKIGLLSSPISASSGNSMINIEYLLNVALDKLPFMSFALSVEKVTHQLFICKSRRFIMAFGGFFSGGGLCLRRALSG